MVARPDTRNQNVFHFPNPNARTYDFTRRSTSGSDHNSCWNVDEFFGAGRDEEVGRWALHEWGRVDQWQTRKKAAKPVLTIPTAFFTSPTRRTLNPWVETKKNLVIDLSPSLDYWDGKYAPAHELFHRHLASIHLDAPLYPSLPTTPLPIRLLFKLPSFLFPAILRDYLISCFLSIQLLVLYSAFDFHPFLGMFPIASWWWLGHPTLFPRRPPEWVQRWQWTSMIVLSHLKVGFWSWVGRWVLGMRVVYEEYTPGRLRDALPDLESLERACAMARRVRFDEPHE
ncbi:hypothetical protein K432DRAFT_403461 [Lepidopterella palustris CBS 459.81]|uniref:Uncharacterized protein n=1 Tax=Lepidopterella palustris CBS 459.81 TaxID=1314670 RepID=A0A8E2JGP7_9PEZI|nr:hypothetical protein K432DRAFT_403461 [Lepidopterella palustris CBS 459.81]